MPLLGAFIVPHPPLIVPEVGKGRETGIKSTVRAYEKIGQKIAEASPETIIVISPHSVIYGDYIHISPGRSARGSLKNFGVPGVIMEKEYDADFAEALGEEAELNGIPAGTLGERDPSLDHGVLVPLYFIDRYFKKEYKLIRLSISGLTFLEHYRFGKCISDVSDRLSRRIVIVASGDLSHKLTPSGPYGYCAEGPEFDARAVGAMKSGDFSVFLNFGEEFCEKAAECGLRSFVEMAGALDGKAVKTDFLSYEGPFGVGYAVCGYEITGPDEKRRFGLIYEKEQLSRLKDIKENEDEYVRLARLSLESYIIGKNKIKRPDALPHQMLAKKAGVFVSLKKDGLLRGCIGTIEPVKACVADEIIENAVSAASKDPRFEPVDKSELPFLVYSVDVLGVPEPVTDVKELDAREYGVIVSAGERRGLLLPNLGGIDTPERQIEIALSKAGIGANEKYRLERFNVVRHK